MQRFAILFAAAVLAALAACSNTPRWERIAASPPPVCPNAECLRQANYNAADIIAKTLQDYEPPVNATIRLQSFTNGASPAFVAPLNQVIPEQISSRLAVRQFPTASAGTARDRAWAELRGTWVMAYDALLVNARVVRLSDEAVVAGYDYELPAVLELKELAGRDPARTLEPTPVVKTSLNGSAEGTGIPSRRID